MTALEMIGSLSNIDIQRVALDALKLSEASLIDANIDQLRKGIRSDGKKIGKYASADYAREKHFMNPEAGEGNVDLILTGEFKDGIFIEFTADTIVFDSSGKDKEGGVDLLYEYGDNVLGVLMTPDLHDELQMGMVQEFERAIK